MVELRKPHIAQRFVGRDSLFGIFHCERRDTDKVMLRNVGELFQLRADRIGAWKADLHIRKAFEAESIAGPERVESNFQVVLPE